MLQPYIGNTKISKLYKGSKLWCDWGNAEPDVPSTFNTIIFCQNNNNIILNGTWMESSHLCFSGTNSYYTSTTTNYITSNILSLPAGNYSWSMYYHESNMCKLVYIIEGDYTARVEIASNVLRSDSFNKILDFNITTDSNIILKLSAEYGGTVGKYCRFFDWKLEKIS